MKKLFGFIAILFIIASCSKSDTNEMITYNNFLVKNQIIGQPLDMDKIFPEETDLPVYLNIINSEQCFYCSESYYYVTAKFKSLNVPNENLIYIFLNKRSIEQEAFMKDNFDLNLSEANIHFDTSLWEQLKDRFSLGSGSYLLKFDQDKNLISTSEYGRSNQEEIVQNISLEGELFVQI